MARLALVSALAARVLGQLGAPQGESVIEFDMDMGPMGPAGATMDGPPPELLKMMGIDVNPPRHAPGHRGRGAAMDGPPPELLKMMGIDVNPPRHAPGHPGSKAAHPGREEDLDRALRSMLGGAMLGGPDPRDQAGSQQGALVIEGPDGEEVVLDAPPQMMQGPRSRMPVNAFQNLFPGPLAFSGPADMDHADVVGFGGPDPMVMDMLQDTSQTFQEQMLPAIHAAGARAGRMAPQACVPDLQRSCKTARSQLHCLGQHAAEVSNQCKADVGRSVPFLCSTSIDRFCDVLQEGILSCLEVHLDALDGPCKDAVLTTRHVIKAASKQSSTLVGVSAGGAPRQLAQSVVVAAPPAHPHQEAHAFVQTPHSGLPPAAAGHLAAASPVAPPSSSRWAWLSSSIGVRVICLTAVAGTFAYLMQSFLEAANGGYYKKGPASWLRAEEGLLRSSKIEMPRPCELAV